MEKITSPLVGHKTTALAKLLWQNRRSIDVPSKAVAVLGMSAAFAPARAAEWALAGRALKHHEITEAPLFVLGHARSGTTHLFQLLAQDPQFGFERFRQSIFPYMCGPMRPFADFLLTGLGPNERPMDDMTFTPDGAAEDEDAIGSVNGQMVTLAFYFPREASRHFEKWALMRDLSAAELAQWQDAVRTTFRKASWLAGGKRLVSKNPWHTSRVTHLHALWPDAPMLHIVRHPYGVFLSAWNALVKGAPFLQLGHVDDDEMRDLFFGFYRDMLQQHLEQREVLPAGQYAELRYEDLVVDPVGQMRRVYEQLNLDGWSRFEPNLRAYLATIADYKPNRFDLDRVLAARIAEEWRFAFDEWGYDPDVLVAEDDE